jgi:hypothetical protein
MIPAAALLLVTAAPQEPALDKLVTFQHRAAPAHQLLTSLSQQTGVQLAPSRELSQELLIVDVKDVALPELMNKLAWATHGAWRQSGARYILERPAEVSARLRREEREAILKGLRESQVRLQQKGAGAAPDAKELLDLKAKVEAANQAQRRARTQRDSESDYSATYQMLSGIQERGPAERGLAKIVPFLDVQDLLAIEPGKGAVFSTHPVGVQRALPVAATRALGEVFAEIPAWNETFSSLSSARPLKVQLAAPSGALLFVSRQEHQRRTASFRLQIVILDSLLQEVASASQTLSSVKETTHGVDCSCVALEKLGDQGTFELSDETVAMANLLHTHRGFFGHYGEDDEDAPKRVTPTPAQREFLLNPERYDIAALGASDALFAIKNKEGAQLVANLADDAMHGMLVSKDKSADLAQARYYMTEGEELLEEGGWMLLRPNFAASATALRTDRSFEGQLIRTAAAGKPLTAEQQQYFSYNRMSYGTTIPLITRLFAVADDPKTLTENVGWGGFGDEWIEKLFESLTPTQIQSMGRGGGIPVSRLTPAQQEAIRHNLFATGSPVFLSDMKGVDQGFFEEIDSVEVPDVPIQEEMAFSSMNVLPYSLGRSFALEASMMLRNGHLPGMLQVELQEEDVLYGLGERGEADRPTSLEQISWMYLMKDDPEMKEYMKAMPKALKRGKSYNYTVKLLYAPNHGVAGHVSKHVLDPKAPTVSLDNLPPDMKKKLAELIEENRKYFGDPPKKLHN